MKKLSCVNLKNIGRRDPVDIRVGDALDFWRVETVEPGKLLRLRAEMKVPGKAWLQFETISWKTETRNSAKLPTLPLKVFLGYYIGIFYTLSMD